VRVGGNFYYIIEMTAATMLMKEIETLPEESVKETLNFVLFLRSRKSEFKNFSEMNTKAELKKEDKFPSMNKPVHLGFDLKKLSREDLYAR